jgi:hypothetical protein
VAESSKFGNPRTEFGDTASSQTDNTHCAQCEAMLADALDGTLTAADQAMFDTHMLTCGPCSQLLADAKRGAAWLEMLRERQPEPPETLVERILAQTTGQIGELAPAVSAGVVVSGTHGVVLPFQQRAWAALRRSAIGQIALQPRLAMTAAMAFFSVALTMDITGMQLKDLNPANLRPSTVRKGFYAANARVMQYYEGLRVVYELESRVHDMESVRGDDTQQGTPAQSAPAPRQPETQPGSNQSAPDKKGATGPRSSSPSGSMRREQPGSRMSLARYVPGHRELAGLDRVMWDLGTGTDVREGRLV